MSRARTKAAELASGLGAMVLGAGLALLAPRQLESLAWLLLFVGLVVHGVGMSLKYRFDTAQGEPLWWERGLFWLCWACLAALGVVLVVRLLAR